MSATTQHGQTPLLLRPGALALPGAHRHRPVLRHPRRRAVGERPRLGRLGDAVRLSSDVGGSCCRAGSARPSPRARAGCTAPRRRLVPLEHELVHLLGGDVLRRLLRRAVLDACTAVPSLGSIENALLWPDFKAVWPSARGNTGSPGRHRRALPDHRPVAAAHHQHAAAADLGRHADDRAPRADRRQARQDDRLDVDHRAAGRDLPVRAGLRVRARLPRP